MRLFTRADCVRQVALDPLPSPIDIDAKFISDNGGILGVSACESLYMSGATCTENISS